MLVCGKKHSVPHDTESKLFTNSKLKNVFIVLCDTKTELLTCWTNSLTYTTVLLIHNTVFQGENCHSTQTVCNKWIEIQALAITDAKQRLCGFLNFIETILLPVYRRIWAQKETCLLSFIRMSSIFPNSTQSSFFMQRKNFFLYSVPLAALQWTPNQDVGASLLQ